MHIQKITESFQILGESEFAKKYHIQYAQLEHAGKKQIMVTLLKN